MYFEEFFESLTESEIEMHEEELKLLTIHPQEIIDNKEEVIQEAIISKEKIGVAFEKARVTFINLTKKLVKIAFDLRKKNQKWLESASKFDINRANLNDFKFEGYDYYRTGIDRINQTLIPKLESVDINDLSGKGEVFKQKAFKNLYVKDENGNEDISKEYFRGGPEKKIIKGSAIRGAYEEALVLMRGYDVLAKKIQDQNNTLNKSYDLALNGIKNVVTESTLLTESLFKDEYYDILLEDAVTPDEMEKENEEKESGTIDTNAEENRKNKENTSKITAYRNYWKICSTVQTMKMDVIREAYSESLRLVESVMNYK